MTKKKDNKIAASGPHPMVARIKEGFLLFVGAMALFLLISLVSFHSSDPGWSTMYGHTDIRNAAGIWGAWSSGLLLSFFGFFAYAVPFLLIYIVWMVYVERNAEGSYRYIFFLLRTIGGTLTVCSGSGLAAVLFYKFGDSLPQGAGGILGNVIVWQLYPVLNLYGTIIVLSASFLVGLTLLSGISWFRLIYQCFIFIKLLGLYGWLGSQYLGKGLYMVGAKLKASIAWLLEKTKDYLDEKRARRAERRVPKVDETVMIKPAKPGKSKEVSVEEMPHEPIKKIKTKSTKASSFKGALPSVALLDKPNASKDKVSKSKLQEMAELVEAKLADFGIKAQVVAALPGPVVTRYELQLAPGMKVSKLSNLSKDLARSLSAISVRVVEVIPGKSVVGIELPNENREIVRLREVLDTPEFDQADSPVTIGLGKDISGQPTMANLAKMPHLLVAGTTGSGKSVGVNAMLISMLLKATPEELRLIMIDPKMLELSVYEGIPHLLTPVVTDMKEAANALRWSVKEMDYRYQVMSKLGVRNISGLNEKIKQAKAAGEPILDPMTENQEANAPTVELKPMPYIVVVVDEFADLIMVVGKKVEELIARIAQKARAAGIHLILATQRPSVDVITGLIKANIPTRMAFQVSSRIDSRTILDQQGAEQLLGHGDMLYLPPGTSVPVRVHGAFVDDDEVHRVVGAWRENGEPDYIETITTTTDAGDDEGGEGNDPEKDPFYDDAVKIVVDSQRASISSVQRRLKIGYNRAARLIEQMEAAGIVSEMQNNGMREVLVPKR